MIDIFAVLYSQDYVLFHVIEFYKTSSDATTVLVSCIPVRQ